MSNKADPKSIKEPHNRHNNFCFHKTDPSKFSNLIATMMRLALTIASLASFFVQGQAQNLVETVVAVEDLSLLEAAVIQADLATTLSGDGPFT